MVFPDSSLKILRRVRANSIARDAGWVLTGQAASFGLQVAYFIVLARILGVEQYGIFAGALALTSVVFPFGSLGSGMLLMRYVSVDSAQFRRYWGNVLVSTFSASGALSLLLWLVSPYVFRTRSAGYLVFVLAVANCLFGQLVQCVTQIFQTDQNLKVAAFVSTLTNALRFCAACIIMFTVRHVTALGWAFAALLTSAIVAAVSVIAVTLRYGAPSFSVRLFFEKAGEGFWFSLAGSTASVYNDADKAMLGHYGMNIANGIYTTAYRIVDIASLPAASIEWAAVPRFFQEAVGGVNRLVARSNRVLKSTVSVGLLATIGLILAAPLVPRLLGVGFAESASALRWLCLLPIFRGVHQISGAGLTASGHQRYRTLVQFGAAAANITLNLWLIPGHGWRGAAWASLASDGLLAVLNWGGLAIVGWFPPREPVLVGD